MKSPSGKDRMKELVEKNARLEKEQLQARAIIEDLRDLVETFQTQLEDTKQVQAAISCGSTVDLPHVAELEAELQKALRETEKFKRETAVLSRALAVSGDGDNLLRHAEDAMQLERLMAEVKRVDQLEVELEHAYRKLESADLQLRHDHELRSAVTALRIDNDELSHRLEVAARHQCDLTEEKERYKRRCDELESITAKLHANQREDHVNATDRIKQLTRLIGQYEHDRTALDSREKTLKQKVIELEHMLLQRNAREQEYVSEISVLRSAVQDMDNEIRNLATSLAAESEANENLSARLERVEGEKSRMEQENLALRRKDKDLDQHMHELRELRHENEQMRKSLFMMQSNVHEKELRISGLEQSREVIRESMSLEIDRLNSEISHMASTSASLSERFLSVSKEKDRFKSLLATDTMHKLAPLMHRPHRQS